MPGANFVKFQLYKTENLRKTKRLDNKKKETIFLKKMPQFLESIVYSKKN